MKNTEDFPFVPRVTFYDKEGNGHVVCGNGAHFVWCQAGDRWIWQETAPVPGSAWHQFVQAEIQREAKAKAASERREQEQREEAERLRRKQEAWKAAEARDRSMTFEQIVFEEIRAGANTSGRLFSALASRSHSRWSRRESERQLAGLILNGKIVEKITIYDGRVGRKQYEIGGAA